MSTSDRYSGEPALDRFGPKPTDRSLPLERRTHAAPYVVALIIVLLLSVALIAFGMVRLTQSSSRIKSNPDATAPSENLAPGAAPGDQQDNQPEQMFDRSIEPAPKPGAGSGQ